MKEPSFSPGRKWRIGFSATLALLSAFALVVMVNYLAARHPYRYNWSASSSRQLSPLTVRVLNSLTNTVKVTVFFSTRDPMFPQVSALIKEYKKISPRLDVEFVDYGRPGRGSVVRDHYRLTTGDGSRVIFDCNDAVQSVASTELSDYKMDASNRPTRTAFKGEQLFTSAIVGVTARTRPKAYFLTGHDEHNPESADQVSGYSRFTKALADANVDCLLFNALHIQDVPDDCALLIIAGPSKQFSTEELSRLDRYLNQGGRMFAAFHFMDPRRAPTGLEEFLAGWNVEVGANWVRDPGAVKVNAGDVVVVNKFGAHPIVRPLLQSRLELVAPRLIGARQTKAARADAPKITELVFTSPSGFAMNPVKERGISEPERTGSVPMAVAVEKGGIQGVAADRGATRIVVMGSSDSFANNAFDYSGNADFALLIANWLLNRDVLLSDIQPRAISEYRLTLTERQMRTLQWIFLASAPGAALVMGMIVWLKRRT